MNTVMLGGREVSVVGVGGHYSKFEEGRFEETYAQIAEPEVRARRGYIEKAFESGITYYDTTWRNEVDMFSRSVKDLGIRDRIHVNSMVLGAFRGSKATGMTPGAYVDKWLDDRLRSMPDHHFNSFMINALEEDYDENLCAELLGHLKDRKKAGDFDMIGFSCHDHMLARVAADRFPEFELIMLAYNYKNRAFERAFDGYTGNAAFVAMKPLIWYEYGIPFAAVNNLPNAEAVLNEAAGDTIGRDPEIGTKAIRWNLRNPLVKVTVCGINSETELAGLIKAGNEGKLGDADEALLERYRLADESRERLPFFIGASQADPSNRRSLQFGLKSLGGYLGIEWPNIPQNVDIADGMLQEFRAKLYEELKARGLYQLYFGE